MPYYIEGEKNAPGGSPDDFLKITKPEEIRLCDPAVGSGHMLTYAFDLLTLIYEEEGYAPTEIPALILRHNLHGLEICPRAAQLAELALVFKAREKSRRFFQPEHLVRPRIIELRDVRFAENELRDYIQALGLGDLFNQPMLRLLHQFEDAKNFGSLIQPCLDERAIADARRAIEAKDLGGQLFLRETHLKVLRVLEQAEALTQRYHVVVANPPYMGGGLLNAALKNLALDTYSKSKADLFAMFIERCLMLVVDRGFVGMITMQTWMFISSFEKLREHLLSTSSVRTMAHLGARAFSSISGEIVQTTAFILTNGAAPERNGVYFRLTDYNSESEKDKALLERKNLFHATPNQIARIPGRPFAYWVSNRVRELFATERLLGEIAPPRKGMITSDNKRFLRVWTEVGINRVGFGIGSRKEAKASGKKWFPYNKGGEARKWFGNREHLVNWEDDGAEVIGYNAKLYGSASRQEADFFPLNC
jgi:type II restriction/modification system DNA methylase subunit YeeA